VDLPCGTVSQYSWMAGRRYSGKTSGLRNIPTWRQVSQVYADGAFPSSDRVAMMPNMMVLFSSPTITRFADVKTMRFFTEMSRLLSGPNSSGTGSVIYKNFWCRYLCPYGALLGLSAQPVLLKLPETRRSASIAMHAPELPYAYRRRKKRCRIIPRMFWLPHLCKPLSVRRRA